MLLILKLTSNKKKLFFKYNYDKLTFFRVHNTHTYVYLSICIS